MNASLDPQSTTLLLLSLDPSGNPEGTSSPPSPMTLPLQPPPTPIFSTFSPFLSSAAGSGRHRIVVFNNQARQRLTAKAAFIRWWSAAIPISYGAPVGSQLASGGTTSSVQPASAAHCPPRQEHATRVTIKTKDVQTYVIND